MTRSDSAHNRIAIGPPAPSLVRFGLSPDADLVYRTLVTFGPRSTMDLAGDLGTAPHRVSSALDELASAGAATTRPVLAGRETLWTARPPAEVVAALRRARLRPVAHERPAIGHHVLSEPLAFGEGLRYLPSRAATRARLDELVAVVRHEQLAMNTEQVFDAESARAGLSVDRTLLDRGVRMRVLGMHPLDEDPMTAYGRDADQPRPDYREATTVPMKLIVVDRKVALLPADPGDFERGYLEVAQPPVVAALVELFERHWASALRPPGLAPPVRLQPRERALIAVLAAGRSDSDAARELRVSRRTVTNMLRALMDRLGVDNRFQLGLTLGARFAVRPESTRPSHDEEHR
jgi:DNA-binding CsgD family transcriptional regulator